MPNVSQPGPPRPDMLPVEFRRVWWEDCPLENLPPAPPTPADEPDVACRRLWWRRVPRERLPGDAPSPADEPSVDCREIWWSRQRSMVRSVRRWLEVCRVEVRDGHAVLYKKTDVSYTTRRGVRYLPGTWVEARDWDPDPVRECGGGLHVCAWPESCDQFRASGIYLMVLVPMDTIDKEVVGVFPALYPEKIRVRRLYVIGTIVRYSSKWEIAVHQR